MSGAGVSSRDLKLVGRLSSNNSRYPPFNEATDMSQTMPAAFVSNNSELYPRFTHDDFAFQHDLLSSEANSPMLPITKPLNGPEEVIKIQQIESSLPRLTRNETPPELQQIKTMPR